MEFYSLGKHCEVSFCRQQDFLPFVCEGCSKSFCKDHRLHSDHDCKGFNLGVQVFLCPICSKGIEIIDGEDLNISWERHSQLNQCQSTSLPSCKVPGCKKKLTNINSIKCSQCHQLTCLSHRFFDAHNCSTQINNSKALKVK
jgi:AN1-like Zinc finger